MTIQRQYSLPNCKLILQGLSDTKSSSSDTRPCLSMLMSAECHFVGHPQPLSGGREFFESLVQGVSQYTQSFLSGIASPQTSGSVQLQGLEDHLHRLTVYPQNGENTPDKPSPIQLDLTTVQLFDLVEAVDQFLADSRTLPELSLQLKPTAKRNIIADQPASERLMPVAIGISGLAVAALALLAIPIPEGERPRDPNPALETASEASTASETSPTDPPTAESTEPPNSTPVETITDPDQIASLQAQLYETIDEAWIDTPEVEQSLVYRVSVTSAGEIVGYKPAKDTPVEDVQRIPLSQLLQQPETDQPSNEPIADFEVIFNPDGLLEIRPWSEVTDSES